MLRRTSSWISWLSFALVTVSSSIATAQEIAGPVATNVEPPESTKFRAGYGGEAIYLAAPDDRLVLFPGLRLQLDGYGFAGPGVSSFHRNALMGGASNQGLQTNFSPRRSRLELGGRILDRFYFFFGGEFGGAPPLSATQQPTSSAGVADAYAGIDVHPLLKIQVGQFDVPFMMESFTSDKYFDFMERSLTVRAAGTYSDKDSGVMLRGETEDQSVNYAVAAVSGNGKNRVNVDFRPTLMGRFFVLPFASSMHGSMKRFHVGASGRFGKKDDDFVNYDVTAMSTPGGYEFWLPFYGKGATETHIHPAGTQSAIAGELYVPILDRFDLRAEFVYVHDGRRESFAADPWTTQRNGLLSGVAYYIEASVWPWGRPRVNGEAGFEPVPKLRLTPAPEPADGLQLAARFEQIMLKYDSLGGSNPQECSATITTNCVNRGALDTDTQDIKVNAVQFAATYWGTKHFRFTLEYSAYFFPGIGVGSYDKLGVFNAPSKAATNQAEAPGARAESFDFNAKILHEVSVRVAIAI
jgi:hypothetical protein